MKINSLKDQMDGPSVPSFSIISRYPCIPLDLCAAHGFTLLLSNFSSHSLIIYWCGINEDRVEGAELKIWHSLMPSPLPCQNCPTATTTHYLPPWSNQPRRTVDVDVTN